MRESPWCVRRRSSAGCGETFGLGEFVAPGCDQRCNDGTHPASVASAGPVKRNVRQSSIVTAPRRW